MIRLTTEQMITINKKHMPEHRLKEENAVIQKIKALDVLNKTFTKYDLIYADTDSLTLKEKSMVEHIMPEPLLKENVETKDELSVLKKSLVEAQAEIQRLNEIIKFLTVEKDKAELITQQTLHALQYLKGKMDEQRQ